MRPDAGKDQTIVWVRGKVCDDMRRPVAGTTIYALAAYHGGIRMYEQTAKTTSDAEGNYELKGPGGLSMFSATLVTIAPGKTPIWAWPDFPSRKSSGFPSGRTPRFLNCPSRPRKIWFFHRRADELNVTVFADGKPAENVTVSACLENANLRDIWAAGTAMNEMQLKMPLILL